MSEIKHLKAKWKDFAIGHCLSSWDDGISPSNLFDLLVEADGDDVLQALIDEHDINVWQPYENMPLDNLVAQMKLMAETGQETEEI